MKERGIGCLESSTGGSVVLVQISLSCAFPEIVMHRTLEREIKDTKSLNVDILATLSFKAMGTQYAQTRPPSSRESWSWLTVKECLPATVMIDK
jgi:hypothetical protein